MMNRMARSTAQSLDFQPIRSGGAATELRALSSERPALAQALPRNIRRAASSTLATLERSVFQKINQYRQQKGLSSLSMNSTITQQARQHSQSMANSRVLSHNGFSGRVQTIRGSIPLRAAAENVAFNRGFSDPVSQAVDGWIKSPGHLQNIMGNFNLTGVGVARNNQGEFYFTQIFIRR
jgi:uncharacterized protein YkwD